MAAGENIQTDKTSQNQRRFDVITLSSDEEESGKSYEELNFAFNRFILACRPHVNKENIKNARQIFTEIKKGKLMGLNELFDMLERYSKEVKETNAVMYLDLICKALNPKNATENELNSVAGQAVVDNDVDDARKFEHTVKQSSDQVKEFPEITTISDNDDFESNAFCKKASKVSEDGPSTSAAYDDTNFDRLKGKISTKNLSEKQRKKLASRLRQRLKELSNQIKILDRAELTLEEMDMCDSSYIQENRLKKKFEKTWTKLCKIQGRPPNTGRVVEKPVRVSSTGYSMIDNAITKFLKERPGSFPDFFDIRDVVLKTNQRHDLRMSSKVMNGIIQDIFVDVGNKLQKRREKDLFFNFGSHLLDDFKAKEDPALASEELARQLKRNRRISKRNLKYVYAKYTHLERHEIDDKERKTGETWSSMVNSSREAERTEDSSSELCTSDDEQEKRHQDHGKSKSKKRIKDLSSREIIDRDTSSDSSASEYEQELSRTEDENVPQSTDLPSLQLPQFERSDTNCPQSPVFPMKSPGTSKTDAETLPDNQTSTVPSTNQNLNASSSRECEILITDSSTQLNKTNSHSGLETQTNTDNECEIIMDPVTSRQTDVPSTSNHVYDKRPKIDKSIDCLIIDDDEFVSSANKKLLSTTSDEDNVTLTLGTHFKSHLSSKDADMSRVRTLCKESRVITPSREVSTVGDNSNISNESETSPSLTMPQSECVMSKESPNVLSEDTSSATSYLSSSICKAETEKSYFKACSSYPSFLSSEKEVSASNHRKRKANTELKVEVTKSTVNCLEQIAVALKHKKLKLPESWKTCNRTVNNVVNNVEAPTTSKESLTSTQCSTGPSTPTQPSTASEQDEHVRNKAKIDLHHMQVFREKTLSALSTKPGSNKNSMNHMQEAEGTSTETNSSKCSGSDEKCEVIIIDD